MPASAPFPSPGAVYTFPLASGMHGACRVLRAPGEGETRWAGHALVCATAWVGQPSAALLKHPDTKKIAKAPLGKPLYWVAGAPPTTFTLAGIVPVSKGDLAKTSSSSAPWDVFPNVALAAWKEAKQPAAAAAERSAAVREGEAELQAEVEALASRDRIDLAGLVDLPKPRGEREPLEVLRGFLAAMRQWERECDRIHRAHGPSIVVRFNQPALARIFDEFCTPRERPNGRGGSFACPPEHDPEDEVTEVKALDGRRVEIELLRRRPVEERVRYVLLRARGAWLVDSKTRNGIKATL